MRLFLALAAVVVSARALPTSLYEAHNATTFARDGSRAFGMASFGGGTSGGWGGPVWTVWDPFALRDAVKGNDPRFIIIHGFINLDLIFAGSPGARIDVGSHKTIVGHDRWSMIYNGGIKITQAENVIVENLRFHNAISYAPNEGPNGSGGIVNVQNYDYSVIDAIEVSESHHVWINHCEFADDPWNGNDGPGGRRRHDGQVDIVRGSNFVTVSDNIFRNHEYVMLIGNSDSNHGLDQGRLHTSIVHNWFQGSQRMPRVRFGTVHVLNNLYTDISSYGIGVGHHASIFAEKNVFVRTPRTWQAYGTTGRLHNEDNLFLSSGSTSAIVGGHVTWHPSQFFRYTPLPISNVEAHVRHHAGPR